MCGIAGIYAFDGKVDPKWIRDMAEILRHRGPDDEGYLFIDTEKGIFEERSGEDTVSELAIQQRSIGDSMPLYNLAFGHRRLSIIDLTFHGHQPMSYDNGNYWIVYNGEIFNYIELKQELKESGFKFKTSSDTEVILASYVKWGVDCAKHFNGDWAFCIYDKTKNILFASRDRFGVRFFYYFWDGNLFAFASETKALFSLSDVNGNLDLKQVYDFLIFGVIDHTEKTVYEKIDQLKPAQNLILDIKSGELKFFSYYSLNFNSELGGYDEKKSSDFADSIKDLFYDAIRIRLRSDVPVGSCLSGGLDSSSIVMLVNRLMKKEGIPTFHIGDHQKTFTASYINDPIDEAAYAEEVIKRTDVDGQFVFPDGKKLWNELADLLYSQDEPFGSTSIYAQWNVMRLASRHVKVVLDGQGGDELFGGYFFYPSQAISQGNLRLFFQRLKLYGGRAFEELFFGLGFRLLPDLLKERSFMLLRGRYLKFLEKVFPQFPDPPSRREEIVKDVIVPNLNRRLWQDFTKYSIPGLLHYEDRNGMAFGVEARVPFLDFRLVDYVMALPAIYKIYNGWSKWIFRIAMRDVLPEKILWRKDKLGFSTPEKRWLSEGDNPFKSFVKQYDIPYDGDVFWWRLFITSYWMKMKDMSVLPP